MNIPQQTQYTTFSRSREIRDRHIAADGFDDLLCSDYVQLDRRPFCARWTAVNLPGSTVRFGREDVAALRRIRSPRDSWLFFIPLNVPVGMRWDGRVISSESLVVCPPSSVSLVFHPDRIDFAIVSAAVGAAPDLTAPISDLLTSLSARIIVPPPDDAQALTSELTTLRTTAEFFPDTVTLHVIHRIGLHLHERLRRCLLGGTIGSRDREAGQSLGDIVQRAEDFFRKHLGEAVSISELATVAGVSEPRLRKAFHQVCMTSPKKYLRLWRLQQVRRSLHAAPHIHGAVTIAATQYGFTELGRFAAEYRTLFGEVPSQTIHRARRDPAVAQMSDQGGSSTRVVDAPRSRVDRSPR